MLELLQAITVCNFKEPNLVSGPILSHLAHQFYLFFKNLAPSVTRYHGQLSSRKISEKINDPILRKLTDGWMDRRTDRQTDGRE